MPSPNVVPDRTTADYFLGVPFGASVGSVGWNPLTLDAQFGYDQRWNFGFQREIANRTEPRNELCRDEGQQSAGVREHQPPRCGSPAIFRRAGRTRASAT